MLEDLKLRARYDGFLYLAESARNPPTIRSHRHVELELNLVVRGSISYVLGGERFTFGPRTLLWLYPAQDHQLVDRSSDGQNFVVVFKPALVSRSSRSADYRGLKPPASRVVGVLHTELAPEAFDLVRRTMEAMLVGAPDPDVLNRELGFGAKSSFRFEHRDPAGLNAGLHHLLLLCWRFQRSAKSPDAAVALHQSVRRALDLLSEGRDEMDLAHLARRCGASETHLSRMFARQMGVSISRYRNSVRLRRFFEHYHGPEQRTITESVYAAGFGSYPQFYRVFAQAYGHGPRQSLRVVSAAGTGG